MVNNKGHNQEEIRELMLHLLPKWTFWSKLADGTHVVKGESGSLFEIRFKSVTSPVLQLQHKQRGNGSRLLRKNVKGNRARRNAEAGKGQTSHS